MFTVTSFGMYISSTSPYSSPLSSIINFFLGKSTLNFSALPANALMVLNFNVYPSTESSMSLPKSEKTYDKLESVQGFIGLDAIWLLWLSLNVNVQFFFIVDASQLINFNMDNKSSVILSPLLVK
jgi:hypothetical protein